MSAPTRSRSLATRLTDPSYVDLVFALVFVWGVGDLLSMLVAANAAASPWRQTRWFGRCW